jgi:hypothetical protein
MARAGPADFGGDFFKAVRPPRAEQQLAALGGEGARRRLAKAARSARD